MSDVVQKLHELEPFLTGGEIAEIRAEIYRLRAELDKYDDGIDWIQRALQAEAELDALRANLKTANAQTEDYERRWYLAKDELDACREALDEWKANFVSVNAKLDATTAALKESRADEMRAATYLDKIRDVIGGIDYEHTIKIAHGLKRFVNAIEDQEES